MNCHVCGQRQHDAEARFCQECGVSLFPPPPVTPTPEIRTLADGLRQVADLVDLVRQQQSDFVSHIVPQELRTWAQAGSRGATPTVVVLGEYRRGKSTLVNRLLGQEIASVRMNAPSPALRIGHPLRASGDDAVHYQSCSAALLEHLDLIDTPAFRKADLQHLTQAMRWALHADAIVFCLDARQLLSSCERDLIQNELLPLTRCPIVLAVTYMDQIHDPQDRQDIDGILKRFLSTLGNSRVSAMTLPPGKQSCDAVPDLQSWITAQVSADTAPGLDSHNRLRTLLTFIEQSLPDSKLASRDRLQQLRDAALAILDREHRHAITQTVSLFREQCSYLRGDLKAILKAAEQSTYGFEAFSHVVRRLQDLLEKCGPTYLNQMQQSLRHDGGTGMRHTSETLNPAGSLLTEAPRLAAPQVPKVARRDWQAGVLEAAAVALAVAVPGLTTVIGASLGLIAANSLRQAKRRKSGSQKILQTEHSLQVWLNETETQLITSIQHAADQVFAEIRQQVVQRFEAGETSTTTQSIHAELRQALAACHPLLNDAEPTPDAPNP